MTLNAASDPCVALQHAPYLLNSVSGKRGVCVPVPLKNGFLGERLKEVFRLNRNHCNVFLLVLQPVNLGIDLLVGDDRLHGVAQVECYMTLFLGAQIGAKWPAGDLVGRE